MKLLAFNGSPRKGWNTATLLEHACEGAESVGADARLIHLADLNYSGCTSCFACKRLGGNSYGRCSIDDDLTPLLAEVEEADAVILGSPIYLGTETGLMRNFMERLIFPYLTYSRGANLFPKDIKSGFVYTMNMKEEQLADTGMQSRVELNECYMRAVFGHAESLLSCDTYQFSDYSLYESDIFDAAAKKQRYDEVFPQDCEAAFQMGVRLAQERIKREPPMPVL
ncbi:flavodoxin family protein [Methanogenium organophilum]|uniref:Flavodoxin family protein n=1 Tax=Methanogenium organophilum TaxID=2199 RepID=A0A9X9S590_METOG|nr:flavodoxin family protein [Methanogenium organophilum]WAI02164.1 flavodoxin family protein [Methanogenium organophilum]